MKITDGGKLRVMVINVLIVTIRVQISHYTTTLLIL